MLKSRVIPVLLLKNRGFYKGVRFKNHSYVGDPINTIKLFNDKEVDELIILDIGASPANSPIDFDYLQEIVSEAFMPVAYGGGIRTLEDAKKLFSLGVEKIILNTAALENPSLIQELVQRFGSQSILFSLDVKKTWLAYRTYIRCAQQKTPYTPLELALRMEKLGAGEIILNSIDRDGTLRGYDVALAKTLSSRLSVPLVLCGGAGGLNDLKEAKEHGAHAMAAGSMFVFHGPHRAVLISYPSYDTLRKLLGE